MAWWQIVCLVAGLTCNGISEWFLKTVPSPYQLLGLQIDPRLVGHVIGLSLGGVGIGKPLVLGAVSWLNRRPVVSNQNETVAQASQTTHVHFNTASEGAAELRLEPLVEVRNSIDELTAAVLSAVNQRNDQSRLSFDDGHATALRVVLAEAVNHMRFDVKALILAIKSEDQIAKFHQKLVLKAYQIEANLDFVSRMSWFVSTHFTGSMKQKKELIEEHLSVLQEFVIGMQKLERSRASMKKDASLKTIFIDLLQKLERLAEKSTRVLADCGKEDAEANRKATSSSASAV